MYLLVVVVVVAASLYTFVRYVIIPSPLAIPYISSCQ